MAKFKMSALVGDGDVISAKLGTDTVANSGHLSDADIGKPLKLVAADTYGLCADGDVIEGFLVGVNPDTQDGYAFGSVQVGGMVPVELDVAVAIGAAVEAGTMAAARTAEANGLGIVSTHIVAATDKFVWQLVSGTGLDEDVTAVIKKC